MPGPREKGRAKTGVGGLSEGGTLHIPLGGFFPLPTFGKTKGMGGFELTNVRRCHLYSLVAQKQTPFQVREGKIVIRSSQNSTARQNLDAMSEKMRFLLP